MELLFLLGLSILLLPISNFLIYREVSRHYKRLLERSDTRLDKANEEILLISKRAAVAPTWKPIEEKIAEGPEYESPFGAGFTEY